MVPDVAPRANHNLYGESTAVTDLRQFADRGHSRTLSTMGGVFDQAWD
jgi:non-heme chloroperoxidase